MDDPVGHVHLGRAMGTAHSNWLVHIPMAGQEAERMKPGWDSKGLEQWVNVLQCQLSSY